MVQYIRQVYIKTMQALTVKIMLLCPAVVTIGSHSSRMLANPQFRSWQRPEVMSPGSSRHIASLTGDFLFLFEMFTTFTLDFDNIFQYFSQCTFLSDIYVFVSCFRSLFPLNIHDICCVYISIILSLLGISLCDFIQDYFDLMLLHAYIYYLIVYVIDFCLWQLYPCYCITHIF